MLNITDVHFSIKLCVCGGEGGGVKILIVPEPFFFYSTDNLKYMYRQNICYISICGKLTNVRLESSTNDPFACVTYMFIIL